MEFAYAGGGLGKGGQVTLYVDGEKVGEGAIPMTQAMVRRTIEGLARDGQMSPVQQGFWDNHGMQCGFCTPGFLIAATALLQENPNPSDAEIRAGLADVRDEVGFAGDEAAAIAGHAAALREGMNRQ